MVRLVEKEEVDGGEHEHRELLLHRGVPEQARQGSIAGDDPTDRCVEWRPRGCGSGLRTEATDEFLIVPGVAHTARILSGL